MFKTFLSQHSFSEYRFCSDIFPTVSDRSFWNSFPNEDCVREAEAALDYAWPIIRASDFRKFRENGNRSDMENVHLDRRNHLILFALAELKENKGRFLPQLVDGLLAICEETYWGFSAHWADNAYEIGNIQRPDEPYIDLYAAETAEHLAMIAHLLRGPLTEYCPEILDRIEYELERRIKVPYLVHRDWFWMGYHCKANNWDPWILSNVLTVLLLSEKNERKICRTLEKMFEELQHYYDDMPLDGGCDEGPSYWNRAGASLFEFLYQLKTATDGKLDLFGDEKIRNIGAYLKKVHVAADYFANIADAHAKGQGLQMPLLFGYARETGQKELMNFSVAVYRERTVTDFALSHTHRTLRRLIYQAEFLREMEAYPVTYPLHGALEYLPDLQFAAIRRGALFLSLKGGNNEESHNHNDVGSFTFYEGVTPVLIDVGINTYTKFTFINEVRYIQIPWTRSLYHNLPAVNGAEQCFGKAFCADGFSAEEEKIEVSFASAYGADAGIDMLTRTLTLSEQGMTCTDRFAFSNQKNRRVTEVLMCVLPVRLADGCAILDEGYRVRTSHGTLSTEWVPFNDDILESDWRAKGVTRILIEAENVDEIVISIEKI